MSLQVITIGAATKEPSGLIIALHGFGANAQDLAPVVPLLNLPNYQFMLPNAPFLSPYGVNGRMWYDLVSERGKGLPESQKLLKDWLLSLAGSTGVPLSRTVLCGFSQGGAMTLDIGLGLPLAGLIVLSGYLHPIAESSIPVKSPPVLLVHGKRDTVVPLQAALSTHQTLKTLGVSVKYYEFDMGHEIRPEVLTLIHNFILAVVPQSDPKIS